MMQFLIGTDFPFMKYRHVAYWISATVIAATTVWLVMHGGPRYSVDFTGGTVDGGGSSRPSVVIMVVLRILRTKCG